MMTSMTSTRSTIAARPLALAAAVLSGVLLAVQSRVNGVVSEHTSQPLIAALWSFASGLVVLCLAVFFVPGVRRGVAGIGRALRERRLAWWQCLGGVVGGTLVAVQAWSVPLIGVTIFSVAVVGGQTLSALAVDRFGLGPVGVQTVTGLRVVAALVAVAGLALVAAARRGLPVALHTPSEVKAAVTGNGRAEKAQVISMVTRILRLEVAPKPADAADALALAICHVWRGGAQDRIANAAAAQARPTQSPSTRRAEQPARSVSRYAR